MIVMVSYDDVVLQHLVKGDGASNTPLPRTSAHESKPECHKILFYAREPYNMSAHELLQSKHLGDVIVFLSERGCQKNC